MRWLMAKASCGAEIQKQETGRNNNAEKNDSSQRGLNTVDQGVSNYISGMKKGEENLRKSV